MATSATLTIKDDRHEFHIYRHWDGYPDEVIEDFSAALSFAWELPRFEASEFAAAVIRAMKNCAGSIYLTTDANRHGDREFHYEIDEDGGLVTLRVFDAELRLIDELFPDHGKFVSSGRADEHIL